LMIIKRSISLKCMATGAWTNCLHQDRLADVVNGG
jgi:hypothetical protein